MLHLHTSDINGITVCNAQKIEVLIPEYFFETGKANDFGGVIKTFGLCPVWIYNQDKIIGTVILNLPTMIELMPKEQDSYTGVVIKDAPEYKYRIARFYRGEKMMPSSVVANSDNVEEFLKMLMQGKIPRYIPYGKLVGIWERNLELNQTSLNVPIGILGLIISYIYRDKLNPNIRFVDALKKDPNKNQLEYTTASMREIAARSSTFAALTFEDQDAMLTASLNNAKLGRKERPSPIEQIIKM